MAYRVRTVDGEIESDADDVSLMGAAAGSAGFFNFTKGNATHVVLVISARQVLQIERVGTIKRPTLEV